MLAHQRSLLAEVSFFLGLLQGLIQQVDTAEGVETHRGWLSVVALQGMPMALSNQCKIGDKCATANAGLGVNLLYDFNHSQSTYHHSIHQSILSQQLILTYT